MESFFGSLKEEYEELAWFSDLDDARGGLFDYIEIFYNRDRMHSGIDYQVPSRYEEPEFCFLTQCPFFAGKPRVSTGLNSDLGCKLCHRNEVLRMCPVYTAVAEREGFEPSNELPRYTLSKRSKSKNIFLLFYNN